MNSEAGIGCGGAREIAPKDWTGKDKRTNPYAGICQYAGTCDHAKDAAVFDESCSQKGSYCVEAIIRGGNS